MWAQRLGSYGLFGYVLQTGSQLTLRNPASAFELDTSQPASDALSYLPKPVQDPFPLSQCDGR